MSGLVNISDEIEVEELMSPQRPSATFQVTFMANQHGGLFKMRSKIYDRNRQFEK